MANVRARVELVGCLSHGSRGRTFERGRPQILTNPAEIAYYKSQAEYRVTMLQAPAEAAPAAKASKAKPKKQPPQESTGEDGDGEDDEGDDGDGGEGEESEGEAVYTKTMLEQQNKAALAELAKADFELELNPDSMGKPKMIAAIMKAQLAKLKKAESDPEE